MEEPGAPASWSSFDRAAEVNLLLEADESLIGTIYRHQSKGMANQQIATVEGSDPATVHAYIKLIEALETGTVANAPSVARGQLGRVRKWLKSQPLSENLRVALEEQRAALESVTENRATREQEEDDAAAITKRVVNQGEPGIYVYTLPHYIWHRYDEETGKTLLKVGHSSRDTLGRFTEQTRVTALPEDPVLLRVYPVEDSARVEREFHAWLRDADHASPNTRRGGSEWFVTSTRFLDRIARSLELEVRVINPAMDIDET